MATRLGLDGKLYYNANSYASPDWQELTRIKDVTINQSLGEADVSTRAGAGWREMVGTLLDGSVDFSLLQAPVGEVDAAFDAVSDAFYGRTDIEFLILNGAIGEAGVRGLRATMIVTKFDETQGLEDATMHDVTIRPTPAANAPERIAY
jgi:hypothetical protein